MESFTAYFLIKNIMKSKMKKCKYCEDLESMDSECPDEPHQGSVIFCDECEADYYVNYGTGEIITCNEQAGFNHPELKKL